MPYRELNFDQTISLRPAFKSRQNDSDSPLALLTNNGPVITIWFIAMLVNILAMLIVLN